MAEHVHTEQLAFRIKLESAATEDWCWAGQGEMHMHALHTCMHAARPHL